MTPRDSICANCSRGFPIPPSAPHKRFCSESCRNQWHSRRRQEALRRLGESDSEPTQEKIAMNPELKDKWLAALRSGNYKQGEGQLCSLDDHYCCLGVLCDVAHIEHQVTVKGYEYKIPNFGDYGWTSSLIPRGFCGLTYVQCFLLAELNDSGKSFDQIADWVEKNVKAAGAVPPQTKESAP